MYESLKLTKGSPQIKVISFNERPWQLRDLIGNDIELVTVLSYPVIADLKGWLIAQGATRAASMSGSGPTVFGIFRTARAAEDAATIAKIDWPDCWVHPATCDEAVSRFR